MSTARQREENAVDEQVLEEKYSLLHIGKKLQDVLQLLLYRMGTSDGAFLLSMDSLQWRKLPSMSKKRALCTAVAPCRNQKVFALGGENDGTCECFDFETEEWKEVAGYSHFQGNNDLHTYGLATYA